MLAYRSRLCIVEEKLIGTFDFKQSSEQVENNFVSQFCEYGGSKWIVGRRGARIVFAG